MGRSSVPYRSLIMENTEPSELSPVSGLMKREELEIRDFHRECFVTPWVDRKTYACRWYNGVGIAVNVKGCILVPREAAIDGTCILYRSNAIPPFEAAPDPSGTDSSNATSVSSPKDSSPSPSLPVIEGEKWAGYDSPYRYEIITQGRSVAKIYGAYKEPLQKCVIEHNASLERVKKAQTDLGK